MNIILLNTIRLSVLVIVLSLITSCCHYRVYATNQSSYQYGYKNGMNIAEEGKAYELGPECSSVGNPEVTNVTACGDGYENGYNHFVSKRWEQRTSSEDLFSYQAGQRQGEHDFDCSFYGGQQSSSIMGNGVHNCSNIIQNVCSIDFAKNITNATSCFSGYVDSWHDFCKFNLTSCDTTLNQLLIGHSKEYWASFQEGKADGKDGKFDVGGQLPVNNIFSQQRIWYSGYYNGYNKYCTKGNDNCPAIPEDGMWLIPSQEEPLAYNLGFSDGFIGEKVPGPHTQNYTHGYEEGSLMYQEIQGAIVPGYLGQPMERPPISFDKNETSNYISWYQQAKHFHTDDGFTISIPSHSDDNYLMFIMGIQDGMLIFDQDNARENGDTSCPLGHVNQKEYCLGFDDGGNIEHQAEDAD